MERPIPEKTDTFLPIKDLYAYLQNMVQGKLWLKVLIGMFAGILLGAFFATQPRWIGESTLQSVINWIAFPGNLFIRVVQMIMIPLMFSSVVQGIAGGENTEYLKKSGIKLLGYYGLTTTTVLTLAVILVSIIRPGDYMDATHLITTDMAINSEAITASHTVLSFGNLPTMITELLPANPLQALVSGDMLSIVIFA